MAKITQEMKDIAKKAKIFVMATASKEGKPNGVPIIYAKIVSDDEIMLVDNFMNKTRQNIDGNPVAAVSFWDLGVGYGYQLKGRARVETSGKLFDEASRWAIARSPKHNPTPKAIVVVKVEEIYYIGHGPNSGKRLD